METLNYSRTKNPLTIKIKNAPLFQMGKSIKKAKVQHRIPMCNRPVIPFEQLPDNVRKIIQTVSEYTKCSIEDILGRSRKGEIVIARHLCVYFCYEIITESEVSIGKWFNRDHSTVYNAAYRVQAYKDTNRRYAKLFNQIKQYLDEELKDVLKVTSNYNWVGIK